MENLIQFYDLKVSGRGRRLNKQSLSVWYNLDGKQDSFGCTLSPDIETKKKRVKIGKLGDDVCLVFTDEINGLSIYGTKGQRKNIVFASKGFCEIIFPELKEVIKSGKDRRLFDLKKINNDIYVFNPINK